MEPRKWQAYFPQHLDTDVDQDMFTTKPRIGGEGVKPSYNCGEISNKTKYGNFPLLAETAGLPHVFTGFYKSSTY